MKNIYKKLFEIQSMGVTFQKTADNPFFKSKYVPLDEILLKLNPILKEKGLLIVHTANGVSVDTRLVDVESGEYVESHLPIPTGIDPQKIGSAITYFKRYNIGQIFNIITDQDDDANDATNKKTPFELAKAGIEKEEDWNKLEEIGKRITASKLYKAEEKTKLLKLIQDRLPE